MWPRFRRVFASALVAAVLVATPAASAGEGERREGSCEGPGHWELRVDRASATRLRIRFLVRDVEPGETWQVFLSDDDERIYAGSRTANDDGRFRVRTITRDRPRGDHLEASAVNADTGGACEGELRY